MATINETAIKTPGVYINEIPSFPPSVAQVATAIPAFVGYTEKAVANGESVLNVPYKIESFTEFMSVFGGEYQFASGDVTIQVDTAADYAIDSIEYNSRYILFDAIRQFYDNGGSKCYVVSVGFYGDTIQGGNENDPGANPGLRVGVKALEKYDEPTLILFPDAVLLADETDFYALQQMTLEQCSKLQDRFAVLDIKENITGTTWETSIQNFRDNIGINALDYGAVYTPWIYTTYDKEVDYSVLNGNVQDTSSAVLTLSSLPVDTIYNDMVIALESNLADLATIQATIDAQSGTFNSIIDRYNQLRTDVITAGTQPARDAAGAALLTFMNAVVAALPAWRTGVSNTSFIKDLDNAAKDVVPTNLGSYVTTLVSIEKLNLFGTTFSDVSFNGYETTATSWINQADVNTIAAHAAYPGTGAAQAMAVLVDLDKIMKGINSFVNKAFNSANAYASVSQDNVYSNHPVISKIVAALLKNLTLLPPSGSMVGIYSKVDATRGVWKAPANVSVNSVVGPSVIIDDLTQEDLNVDVTAGKSINAIRAFTGKGTIVWGARTLNGNSSEWRYINVRRLFIMVEESSKKASSQFVFEPNDPNTWVKIRAMIENYLTVLWRQGALAGAKPEHAFFVKVGLGQTMTADDILRGVLVVEIGMAAVRPAEFIILRFMHKMQES